MANSTFYQVGDTTKGVMWIFGKLKTKYLSLQHYRNEESMKGILASFIFLVFIQNSQEERILLFNGSEVRTTFKVDGSFYGIYKGSKQGNLELRTDGTGTYRYDYSTLMRSCDDNSIEFEGGFLLDDNGEVVRFERPYGYSYPILYCCTGKNTFRNCTMPTMIDYILVYNTGIITVSSSDDWKKDAD